MNEQLQQLISETSLQIDEKKMDTPIEPNESFKPKPLSKEEALENFLNTPVSAIQSTHKSSFLIRFITCIIFLVIGFILGYYVKR